MLGKRQQRMRGRSETELPVTLRALPLREEIEVDSSAHNRRCF